MDPRAARALPHEGATWKEDLGLLRTVFRLAALRPSSLVAPVALGVAAILLRLATFVLFLPLVQGVLSGDFGRLERIGALGPLVPDAGTDTMPLVLGGAILALSAARASCAYGSRLLLARRCEHASARLSALLLQSHLGFGQQYYDLSRLGDNVRRVQELPARIPHLIRDLERTFRSILALALYGAVMMLLSAPLALAAGVVLGAYYFAAGRSAARLDTLQAGLDDADEALGKATHELLLNLPLVRLSGQQAREAEAHLREVDRRARAQRAERRLAELVEPVRETFDVVVLLAFLAGAALWFGELAASSAPLYVIFFLIFRRAMGDFSRVLQIPVQRARLRRLTHALLGSIDPANKFIVPGGARSLPPLRKGIELRDLRFRYVRQDRGLRGLSAFIPSGERTFLVGATGSGKSTLLSLLLRLYDCPPDSIFFDDMDIRSFDVDSLRSRIVFSDSEPRFFDDTLRRNVCYGAGDVSEEGLRIAARRAQVLDVVDALPEGFETRAGDRGTRLSSGERQRLALLRVFLSDADVILLDEATSALDAGTEARVLRELWQHAKDRTIVVVAHRLTNIGPTDHVVVLKDGRCVEQGPRDALLAQDGELARLWRSQRLSGA